MSTSSESPQRADQHIEFAMSRDACPPSLSARADNSEGEGDRGSPYQNSMISESRQRLRVWGWGVAGASSENHFLLSGNSFTYMTWPAQDNPAGPSTRRATAQGVDVGRLGRRCRR